MASGNLSKEDARFEYTDGGAQIYKLRVPLAKVTGGLAWGGQWTDTSLDGSVFEVLTIASSDVPIVNGIIRYEDLPLEMIQFIEAGQKGITLTYFADKTGAPANNVAVNLLSPAPGASWQMGLETSGPKAPPDKFLRIALKRTDESAFPSFMFDY